jgi:ferrous iron transport protein B
VSAAARLEPQPVRVALVGNPNTGKSTLFNALTGLRQHAANFPGVTVERMEGSYRDQDVGEVRVVDLPGCYSLSAHSADEVVAHDVLLGRLRGTPAPDVVVVVVDAEQLERNLFLASQVLELGLPTIIALNRMDALAANGAQIDVPELIHELGATVIPVVATRGQGIEHLRRAIALAPTMPRPTRAFTLPLAVASALQPLELRLREANHTPATASLHALRFAGDDASDLEIARVDGLRDEIVRTRHALAEAGVHPGSLEAETRYGWIAGVVARTLHRADRPLRTKSDRVDALMMHRVWGPLIFVAMMGLMFQAIFTWSRPLTEGIDTLMTVLGNAALTSLPAGDLRSLVVDGAIAGVGSVLAFVPQIFILFLFIGILEDTGYMARAAFVMDRFLRPVGLHGKSFIPLISGYACAVPAIMSARTIQEPRDRLATIMVVPLMSCSARLPVYTLLIGAFVPPVAVGGFLGLQGLTLLAMYALGTLGAFFAASIFRRTLLRGPMRPMIIELPSYCIPNARTLLTSVWHRVRLFLVRAGTIIFAVSIVLWALASFPKASVAPGTAADLLQEKQLSTSVLGRMGHAIEPIVAPLGYDWKIGVSMLASFSAREVFVSTMGTIHGVGSADGNTTALTSQLRTEKDPATGRYIYTPLIAIGLLVFYVFAPMCMSTLTVTARETGGGRRGLAWAGLQAGYMLTLAYVTSYAVFHIGRALGYG